MTATADHTGTVTGRVVRVTGPVVDVEFPAGKLPHTPIDKRQRADAL